MNFGKPQSQQYLDNTIYSVLYSYALCGPQCAYGTISPYNRAIVVEREDTFREDLRLPEAFRLGNADYSGTGFDRGHLWNSADSRRDYTVQSESFLLSNMSPQAPGFNRGIWKELESSIRNLAQQDELVLNVHISCGPWFNAGNVEFIGDSEGRKAAIPHGFWKVALAEYMTGSMRMWGFAFPNAEADSPLASYQLSVSDVESMSGTEVFPMLRGIGTMKTRTSKLWETV